MRKRRIIYYIMLFLTLIVISFYGGAVSYGIFYFTILIPIISYIYLFAVLALFKIYQSTEGRELICGTPKEYYFVLKNESWIAFSSISIKLFSSFSTIEELPDDTEFCLLKGEKYRYDTRVICKYRGEYEIGIKEIVLTDFLNLFQLKYKVLETIKAIVSPRIINIESIKGLEEVVITASRESYYQKDELDTVVRDYVPGDPIKNINWMLTAKEGALKTRLMTGEEKQGIYLLMDTKRYSMDNRMYIPLEDQMITTMIAIALYFAKKGIPLKVIYEKNGIHHFDLKGIDDFQNLYKIADSFIFSSDNQFQNILDKKEILDCAIVISIVHEMTDGYFSVLKELSDIGTYVVSYLVTNDERNRYESTLRNKIINVPVDRDISEVL